jgi:hypothetical protein
MYSAIAGAAHADRLSIDKSLVTFDGLHPADSEFFERVYVTDPFDLSGYTHNSRLPPRPLAMRYRHGVLL